MLASNTMYVKSFSTRSASTEDYARLGVAASSLGWVRFDRTFFNVRVFNPHAPSNQSSQIAASYRRHEKRNKYEQHIRETEHATFAPFVLSSSGGMGPCAMTVKETRSLLAEKHNVSYSSMMGLLCCRLNFALLRSSIMCICGSRSSRHRPRHIDLDAIDLAITEGGVALS